MIRAVFVVLLLAACGGPRLEHAECKRLYDTCMQRCADLCEGPSPATEWSHEVQGDNQTGWSGECRTCLDHCHDQADRCEAERR
jgi:hypothetical protein